MSLVRYGQSGYVGSSMSENALLAYEDGEMPRSKWTMMTVRDFMAFRHELVEAEKSHPEWRKVASPLNPGGGGTVPAAPGAKTYWRLRNGTRGIVRHWSNGLDDLAQVPGYVRHISQTSADASLSADEERLVSKWIAEWEELKGRQEL